MLPTKHYYYAVTGANAGLGLESVLSTRFTPWCTSLQRPHNMFWWRCNCHHHHQRDYIFVVCRNPVSPQQAIDSLTASNEYPTNVSFKHVPFDPSIDHL